MLKSYSTLKELFGQLEMVISPERVIVEAYRENNYIVAVLDNGIRVKCLMPQ